jgi:hypothetical protein
MAPEATDPDAESASSSRKRAAGLPSGERRAKSKSTTSGATNSSAGAANILSKLANKTSDVVQQAASILEEEIAAGIVAARQVEERLINVKAIRSRPSDEVIQRYRRDAHDALDIVLDVIHAATKSVGELAQRAISIRSGETLTSGPLAPSTIPTLSAPQPVKAGDAVEIPMAVENDSHTQTAQFSFHVSDLINESGSHIAASQITLAPALLTLGPRQSEKVTVTIHVPAGTAAGSYAGLLQATNFNQLRAVLAVQVSE